LSTQHTGRFTSEKESAPIVSTHSVGRDKNLQCQAASKKVKKKATNNVKNAARQDSDVPKLLKTRITRLIQKCAFDKKALLFAKIAAQSHRDCTTACLKSQ
jgi:hypothetical protein